MEKVAKNYKFSIIVPVYNAEYYLEECINSVINQKETESQDFYLLNSVQLILVNDGSLDGSADICKKYANEFPDHVTFIDKKNAGVSSARNAGIRVSKGKYILMLDSDDMLGSDTLTSLFDFFENVYDLVDVITYPLYYYKEGAIKKHGRTQTYFKDQIVDVDNEYFVQPTSNICFKNIGDESFLYDEDLDYCEDSFFSMDIILKKKRIGVCSSGKYLYRRDSDQESAVTKYMSAYFAYDILMNVFIRKCIDKFSSNNKLPRYVQNVILQEINWRLKSKKLIPFHKDEIVWKSDFKYVLNFFEDTLIISNPVMDSVHKFYLLELKNSELSLRTIGKTLALYNNNYEKLQEKAASDIVLTKFDIAHSKLLITGFLKEPYSLYADFKILVSVNGDDCQLNLYESNHSFYKSSENMGHFKAFDLEIELDKLSKDFTNIQFFVNFDRRNFNSNFVVHQSKKIPQNIKLRNNEIINGNLSIKLTDNEIEIRKLSKTQKLKAIINNEKNLYSVNKKAFLYRMLASKSRKKIWLYNDRDTLLDNAYYQFKHDIRRKDGVKRYFIIKGKLNNIDEYFTRHEQKFVVQFGSLTHKYLFLNCDKILYSFNAQLYYSPFGKKSINYYLDKLNYQQIYLQHGVLHANVPKVYGRELSLDDKIVISSEFEYNNFINTYNYKPEQLIKTGMPRFDIVNKKAEIGSFTKKIIFVPTWRSSFLGPLTKNGRFLKKNKFLSSSYYNEINGLLNNKDLHKLLEENNIKFDFGIHPLFDVYKDFFTTTCKNININTKTENLTEYDLCITDFSSFVFDFVYYKKPILYFMPDMDEWKCYNHTYNKLDLPLEKGFGEVTENVDDFIVALERIIEADFEPTGIYKERIENFFIEKGNHRERLYNELMKDN